MCMYVQTYSEQNTTGTLMSITILVSAVGNMALAVVYNSPSSTTHCEIASLKAKHI